MTKGNIKTAIIPASPGFFRIHDEWDWQEMTPDDRWMVLAPVVAWAVSIIATPDGWQKIERVPLDAAAQTHVLDWTGDDESEYYLVWPDGSVHGFDQWWGTFEAFLGFKAEQQAAKKARKIP